MIPGSHGADLTQADAVIGIGQAAHHAIIGATGGFIVGRVPGIAGAVGRDAVTALL